MRHSRARAERTGKTIRFEALAKLLSNAMTPNTWWERASRLTVASANKQILRHWYDE